MRAGGLVLAFVFFASGCRKDKDAEVHQTFAADVPGFVALWDAPCKPGYGGKCESGSRVEGKVLVVDVDKAVVDPTQRKLDDRIRAAAPADVGSVALVRYSEGAGDMYIDPKTGKYANAGKAVNINAEVRVINRSTGQRTAHYLRIEGPAPGFVVGDQDSVHKGDPPHERIAMALFRTANPP